MRVAGIASQQKGESHEQYVPFGSQLIIRVQAEQIFPNCPRYIHKMQIVKYFVYAPRLDYTPPEPEWKQMEEFRDALPNPNKS